MLTPHDRERIRRENDRAARVRHVMDAIVITAAVLCGALLVGLAVILGR